ncbi:pyridoxal-phosphate dependent enzyme [Xanthomonas campestris]|uniref:pyridoxal-phosphate dependent enzyme n=1 Tax=Xanthomonas campestris TaxID=339 RepID=UPI000676EFC4|nr:pyridoxal-phosphate dependent enzyme [Xanthomonas campestris]AKS17520.1 cystathionine beta-synthase [Xanthomonas campestris pv. campestris]MCD0250084.1 pyridoxal-phosphate dependent enzyme [Xanthomonas campestris pv. campestris]MCD0262797.1 pyridoxal-phosphate dependent enzyme [Xanthomonas campestris pv. campestris]MCD0271468.1 pyridoxal-phosphate dependent enzyme [Xanthomonas campestris pv. campestris]MCD0276465.1 pyridoxal-phosphate dependent enzyme [Xanthomonas campestris pv. campestris]
MAIHSSVLELIGNTPIVKAQRLDTGVCELFLKLEASNPGGSIKDRIGLSMIEAAEQRGDLRPGATLVEGTAGNTGLGLALVAQQKGYRLILVVPDKMSREKIFNLKAMGADVVLTRSDVAKGHPEYYQDLAAKIASETPGAYFINQFGNPDNPAAHEFGTGPEILAQMDGQLDAIVFGCGSSGTMTGLSRAFATASPQTELVLADPVGSILTQYIEEGTVSEKSGSWLVEGIGEDFLPDISDFSRVKKAYSISDAESFHTARELLAKEGILGGSSTGTLLAAALKYCREQTTPKRVLVFVCDTGNKYLSKMYNDYWMLDNGFLEREQHGDLRDLILRPYNKRDTVVVGPKDLLTTAYQRMKLYDVSQLPVIDNGELVGIVDESDVLLHVYGDEARFRDPISTAMVSKLDRLDVASPIEALLPVFDRGQVAIVMDGNQFLGLITRIDLLNYLRRRVQ